MTAARDARAEVLELILSHKVDVVDVRRAIGASAARDGSEQGLGAHARLPLELVVAQRGLEFRQLADGLHGRLRLRPSEPIPDSAGGGSGGCSSGWGISFGGFFGWLLGAGVAVAAGAAAGAAAGCAAGTQAARALPAAANPAARSAFG